MTYLLEVCTESADGALRAVEAGAGRIELCARLDLDGLTPSLAELRRTLRSVEVPVHAMIRPREGDFIARPGELEVMAREASEALEAGAHGLVLGLLTPGNDLDLRGLEVLLDSTAGAPVTFHRAFDRVREPSAALEALIDLGVARLLTTGGPPTAWEGRDALRSLVERAAGRIVVMPGGGVRADHAELLATHTGARELHGSVAFRPGERTEARP